MDCEIVVTRLGATAVYDRVSGETMHPMGGQVEARGVYVGPSRLEARLREGGPPLVLLDVGLGAASNAIEAWRLSESLPASARRLEIVSFDNDLSALKLVLQPEHAAAFGLESTPVDAFGAASAIVARGRHDTARTEWRLVFGDLLVALAEQPEASADVVFWDMFARGVDPELWTTQTFRALRRVCRAGATLHTYNAATSTRAGLLLAGFAVGIGGPTGDRGQTTIAAVSPADLEAPLDARWLQRLGRSHVPFPTDIGTDPESHAAAVADITARPQFQAGARVAGERTP